MAVSVQFKEGRFCFEEYPGALLEYKKEISEKEGTSFEQLRVKDSQSERISAIFVKADDLRSVGFSIKTWKRFSADGRLSQLILNTHKIDALLKRVIPIVKERLSPERLTSFEDGIPAMNASINYALVERAPRLSMAGIPGLYFDYQPSYMNTFINLKGTPPLGQSTFGKVREVLWLNPPEGEPQIVAKKVQNADIANKKGYDFQGEIAALRMFSGQRGIVSLIAGGYYKDKWAIFMEMYPCDAAVYLKKHPQIPDPEKLEIASQWLDGLATIAEQGIHGDIKLTNLFLGRNTRGDLKAVIGDFGAYRPYGREEGGLTTATYAPPEYFKVERLVSQKLDVWGLGICLYVFFLGENAVPEWINWGGSTEDREERIRQMTRWTSGLALNWALEALRSAGIPDFVASLINRMLDPCPDDRISAKEASLAFLAGRSASGG